MGNTREEKDLLKINPRDFPRVQWLRLHVSTQGVQVQSQVMEIRSHMIYGYKTKTQDRSNIVKASIMPLKSQHQKIFKKQKY